MEKTMPCVKFLGGILCVRPNRKLQRREMRWCIKNAGAGVTKLKLTADECRSLKFLFEENDFRKRMPHYIKLWEKIKAEMCPACEGMGAWPSDMGESLSRCPECKGTGLHLAKRKGVKK